MEQDRRSMAVDGGILAGIALLGNATLSIAPGWQAALVAGGCVGGGLLLDRIGNGKIEKLFRICGLENKAHQIPVVIKRERKGTETTYVIHLPEGISQKHFEQHQQELEQALNAKIEFGFNKNLIMNLTDMNLKTMYPFLFEECKNPLEVYCGNTHSGKFILDIEKCPHAILAGETGGGKTSLLDIIVLSLMLNKHDISMHLIDFQSVGLGKYEDCKKVLSYGETPEDFEKIMDEMEAENAKRLKLFRSVKNKVFIDKLSVWNKSYPNKAVPYKVVIVDEFSRLAEEKYKPTLERFRNRVGMDRKTGIHYLISMQRPDVKCIEGSIKANMPTRIAFKTVTDTDSEVILDVEGAEKLKNPGRFLAKYNGEIIEVQSMYIPSQNIMKFLKQNNLFKPKKDTYFKEQAIEDRQNHIKKWHETNSNPYGVKK